MKGSQGDTRMTGIWETSVHVLDPPSTSSTGFKSQVHHLPAERCGQGTSLPGPQLCQLENDKNSLWEQ